MFRSPLFGWSPRPEQDPLATPPTQSPSRFGNFQSNVRSMINGSSVYSQSPALPSHNNTPKVPFLGFLHRLHSPDPNALRASDDVPAATSQPREPLHAQHTAGSYIRDIAPLQDPQEPAMIYNRHPADVPLSPQQGGYSDPDARHIADEVHGRRRRRKHKKRRHHRQPDHWVRRRNGSIDSGSIGSVRGNAATRGKMMSSAISGTFLLVVLAVYLAIALTNREIGQEIHILFIMVLLTITIFFCHSLIRLCMLLLNPVSEITEAPRVPNMTGPDGFQPIVPIRVHLARDEEAGLDDPARNSMESNDPEKDKVTPPPPAYGLWRSSVRVNPDLLHWQRVGDNRSSMIPVDPTHSRNGPGNAPSVFPAFEPTQTTQRPTTQDGPRPPSYVSEDGVSYIVEAAPRSTVNNRQSHTGVSDIHPAWRPGYAMSEVRGPYGRVL